MKTKLNLFLFVTLLLVDQLTKWLAYTYLEEGVPVPIIPHLFNLTLVYNPGAAFGMFGDLPDFWRRIVLLSVSVVALSVVVRFMLREAKGDPIAQAALSGILAGAIGNIIDRIRFDSVVDFLDFYWNQYHWPAFNVADSAISVGVFILVVRILFAPEPNRSLEGAKP